VATNPSSIGSPQSGINVGYQVKPQPDSRRATPHRSDPAQSDCFQPIAAVALRIGHSRCEWSWCRVVMAITSALPDAFALGEHRRCKHRASAIRSLFTNEPQQPSLARGEMRATASSSGTCSAMRALCPRIGKPPRTIGRAHPRHHVGQPSTREGQESLARAGGQISARIVNSAQSRFP